MKPQVLVIPREYGLLIVIDGKQYEYRVDAVERLDIAAELFERAKDELRKMQR